MNKQEYKEYQETVEKELSGLTHLSQAHIPDGQMASICEHCQDDIQLEPYFSWSSCECCGSSLGGDRYHANGINKYTHEVNCYEICPDCLYYAEYGQLDDMTMMKIEV